MDTPIPVFRDIDWKTLVQETWGERWAEPETAYQFSNGRKFKDPGSNGGPYADNPPADN